jgi:hypothetical protein
MIVGDPERAHLEVARAEILAEEERLCKGFSLKIR